VFLINVFFCLFVFLISSWGSFGSNWSTLNDITENIVTATHCHSLQHAATQPLILEKSMSLQHTATHCNTLQHTATHCNTAIDIAEIELFED